MAIIRKSHTEIDKMERAGRVVVETLALVGEHIKPGVTTGELDAIAADFIRSRGGIATFLGYRGFPASICTSPNSMVVHGIPGDFELSAGDLISIDVGVVYGGWVADAALTVALRPVSPVAGRLLKATRESLEAAVAHCRPGSRLGDVSHAVQQRVEDEGFSVIRSLVGHGIGRQMHEDPQVPNFGEAGRGVRLEEGMVFCVEPMVCVGGPAV